MKKGKFLIAVLIVLACLIPGQVNTASANSIGHVDFCTMTVSWYVPSVMFPLPPNYSAHQLSSGWWLMTYHIPAGVIPVAAAPVEHEDGRLNFRVCRAPLAAYLNEDGSVEVWSTDEENMFAPLVLVASATADEIAAALAEAEATGKDVIISGYTDGFALIATMNGTLKAELIGVYGFEFLPDGTTINGWGEGFEPYDPGPLPPV